LGTRFFLPLYASQITPMTWAPRFYPRKNVALYLYFRATLALSITLALQASPRVRQRHDEGHATKRISRFRRNDLVRFLAIDCSATVDQTKRLSIAACIFKPVVTICVHKPTDIKIKIYCRLLIEHFRCTAAEEERARENNSVLAFSNRG
jgi:hypothetical protein